MAESSAALCQSPTSSPQRRRMPPPFTDSIHAFFGDDHWGGCHSQRRDCPPSPPTPPPSHPVWGYTCEPSPSLTPYSRWEDVSRRTPSSRRMPRRPLRSHSSALALSSSSAAGAVVPRIPLRRRSEGRGGVMEAAPPPPLPHMPAVATDLFAPSTPS